MERSAWTDERLDDVVARTDKQFDLIWAEMRDMRTDMRDMRCEMHDGFVAVRRDMLHGAIAIFGSQIAILGVLVAQAI